MLFSLPVFGLFLGTGFLAASFYLWKMARRGGYNEEKAIDAMLLTAVFSLLGARVGYILLHLDTMGIDAGKWFLFLKYPGLSFIGALIGGLLALLLLGRVGKAGSLDKTDLWDTFDLFSLPLAILSIFGYTGCFFNGCYINNFYSPLVFAGIYLLLLLGFVFIQRKTSSSSDWANLVGKPGFFIILYLLVTSSQNMVLEKINNGRIYYFWLIALIVTTIVFVFRFSGLVKKMIKFPPNVLSRIKNYLEQRKAQTEHRLEELKKEDPFEDNGHSILAADDAEANEKASHERTQALMAQMNLILIQTRKALTKIKIGKYGTCENCGKMIDTDRLAAMPTATLCLSCEKKKEK